MKKYQIFISSTYNDLKTERTAVRDAIMMMHQFPIGMEQFTASDDDQWKVIRELIDCSDYYVLIIGKRYGSLIEDGKYTGISYTQREFEYALSRGVPVLAFIKANDASFSGDSFETDSVKLQKLIDFTESVKTGRVVNWFKTPGELSLQVTAALNNAFQKNDRPGWIRGDQTNIESKVDELINLLKDEYGFGDSDSTIDYDNEVEDSEFQNYQMPTDGQHRRINKEGNLIAEGEWKNRILVKGTEFDYLILVTSGNLIFKPDCPGDPYDASDDFDYVKYDQYGWHLHDFPFLYSREAIVQHGLEKFYVVDFKVTEKSEQMFHIRTLKEFLEIMSPDYLKELQMDIALEKRIYG